MLFNANEYVVADGDDIWQAVVDGQKAARNSLGADDAETMHVEFDEIRAHRTTILLGLLSAFGVVCCILFLIWICSRLHERDRNRYRSIP